MVVIGHQVLYPCRRETETGGSARGRSNDTGYRVFHKDSMKIARDFITGEMSVNKNEYAGQNERAGEREAEGEEVGRRAREDRLSFYSPLPRLTLLRRSSFDIGSR